MGTLRSGKPQLVAQLSKMGSSGSAEQKALDFDLKKVKIRRHVGKTEDADRARTASMYDGEYDQLNDQVYDLYLKAPEMQTKLTQLAHELVKALGQAGRIGQYDDDGTVTVTDDVIKMVPKMVQKMMGRSDCDTEKHAYMEALLTQWRDIIKRTDTWTEAIVMEFLESLFTGRTLLATSLNNGAKQEARAAARAAEIARQNAAMRNVGNDCNQQ